MVVLAGFVVVRLRGRASGVTPRTDRPVMMHGGGSSHTPNVQSRSRTDMADGIAEATGRDRSQLLALCRGRTVQAVDLSGSMSISDRNPRRVEVSGTTWTTAGPWASTT